MRQSSLDLAKEKGDMRIAQVAPLIESVPPKHYGGTERIVSYLTEEIVRFGHEVTLFASGDSVTNARLIAPFRRSVRKNERCKDPMARGNHSDRSRGRARPRIRSDSFPYRLPSF